MTVSGLGSGDPTQDVDLTDMTFADAQTALDEHANAGTDVCGDAILVSVQVTDKDLAPTEATTTATVVDVAPYGTTLDPSRALVEPRLGNTTFTRAGQVEAWSGHTSDVSVVDGLTADLDWGDGLLGSGLLPGIDKVDRPLAYQHAWANPCLYRLSVGVTDDDTLSAPTLQRWVVVTKAAVAAGAH